MKKLLLSLLFAIFGLSGFAHAAAPYDDAQNCVPATGNDGNSATQACIQNGTCCVNSTSVDRFAITKQQDLKAKVAGILGTSETPKGDAAQETK